MTTRTRDLPTRMLAAVEDRVRLNMQRADAGSVQGRRKAAVRLNESSEILGMLRNVIAKFEDDKP